MLLEKFIKTIKAKDRSQNTLELLGHTVGLCEKYINKSLEDASYEEIMDFIEHIKVKGMKLEGEDRKEPLSKNSIFTVENKLIQFYTFCFNETDDPKYHKMVKKLKSIQIDKPKNKVRAQDILFPEEIKKLINVATIERDRCIVAVMFESGVRIGELRALNNNMIEMDEAKQEVIFHIPDEEGCKTGARDVLCTDVYGYVQDYLKCNTSNKFIPLTDNGISGVLEKLYKKAGINKPHNAHMLRHSSITNACILKMQPNQISMRYWGIPNSNMLSIYLHLSEQIINSGYRDAKGLGNGNGTTIINPLAVRCVKCGSLIQSGSLCIRCKENDTLNSKLQIQEGRLAQQDEDNRKLYDELQCIKHSKDEDIEMLLKEMENMKKFQIAFFKDQKAKNMVKQ